GRGFEHPAHCISATLDCDISGIQFDEHGITAEFRGNLTRGPAAGEWIENRPALRSAGKNTGSNKVFGEDGEVRTRKRSHWNTPNGPLVFSERMIALRRRLETPALSTRSFGRVPLLAERSAARRCHRFPESINVVVIAGLLTQEKQVFVSL